MKNYLFNGLLCAFLIFATKSATSQCDDGWEFDDTIVTDRPDQTEAPNLVPQGYIQLEVGAQSELDRPEENLSTESTLMPTTLLKYGLSKNFELRLISEYAQENYTINAGDQRFNGSISGMSPLAVGCKIRIREADGFLPKISLISHLELPYFGEKSMRPENIVPRFRFLFAHSLSERVSFSYNLGGEWESGASNSTFIYTASLGVKLTEKMNMFAESYGFMREYSTADHRIDGGITYLISNDIQADISGGIGLSEVSPDYLISCGLSFRLNTKKNLTNLN